MVSERPSRDGALGKPGMTAIDETDIARCRDLLHLVDLAAGLLGLVPMILALLLIAG